MNIENIKDRLLKLDTQKKIQFIVFFGSRAEGRENRFSDTDIAVYYKGTARERFKFRIKALGEFPEKIDAQIFQDLPLPVQKEVLKGKVIFYRNFQFTFDAFMKVIKEFDRFERQLNIYYDTLRGEEIGAQEKAKMPFCCK